MTDPTPTSLEPPDAARALMASMKDPRAPHTVADATAESGLAIRDAERGLTWLTQEYRGHLRATEDGQLLYLFPYGFTQPWKTRDAIGRAWDAALRTGTAVLRFVVRAWLMIVLLAYVAIFVAILIGMMFAKQGDNNNSRRGGDISGIGFVLFRVLADALFWTFHPFSPFNAYGGYGARSLPAQRSRGRKDETPFYEKVNRFFFGPTPVKEDPRTAERAILAQLRAQKGRIGLADVMRVTGLPRSAADPLMAKLMLDYDGDVSVSEDGGITYHFEAMRKTAAVDVGMLTKPRAAWEMVPELPPLTGNPFGTNVLIAALNMFNIVMSMVAFEQNLTLAKLPFLFSRIPLWRLHYDGTPIVLGVIPLVFSLAIFLIPIGRALIRPIKAARLGREKGRLAVMREVLTRVEKHEEVTDQGLDKAWGRAAGRPPLPGELTRYVADLGADVQVDGTSPASPERGPHQTEKTGGVRYRFADLETEAKALEEERQGASEEEKKVGRVVFASDE
jgi:hypothetical protein